MNKKKVLDIEAGDEREKVYEIATKTLEEFGIITDMIRHYCPMNEFTENYRKKLKEYIKNNNEPRWKLSKFGEFHTNPTLARKMIKHLGHEEEFLTLDKEIQEQIIWTLNGENYSLLICESDYPLYHLIVDEEELWNDPNLWVEE